MFNRPTEKYKKIKIGENYLNNLDGQRQQDELKNDCALGNLIERPFNFLL